MKTILLLLLSIAALLTVAGGATNWKLIETKYGEFLSRLDKDMKSLKENYDEFKDDLQTCWDSSKSFLNISIGKLISSQNLTRSGFDSALENVRNLCNKSFNTEEFDRFDHEFTVAQELQMSYNDQQTIFKDIIDLLPKDRTHYTYLLETANWTLIMEKYEKIHTSWLNVYKRSSAKVGEGANCLERENMTWQRLETDIKEKSLSKERLDRYLNRLADGCTDSFDDKFEKEKTRMRAEFNNLIGEFKEKHYPDFIHQIPEKCFKKRSEEIPGNNRIIDY